MFPRYQRHVQWAKSVLQEQGLDDCSVTKILDNYTKPVELPLLEEDRTEQTSNSWSRTDLNRELAPQSSTETGNRVALSIDNQHEGFKKACLERDPQFDPVAICGSEEQKQDDLKEKAEVSCQKHGALVPCSCTDKEKTQQGLCEMIRSEGCVPEYVLVEEEVEGSLSPEDGSAHAEENVRTKSPLIL